VSKKFIALNTFYLHKIDTFFGELIVHDYFDFISDVLSGHIIIG